MGKGKYGRLQPPGGIYPSAAFYPYSIPHNTQILFHICFLYNLGMFIGIEPDVATYVPGRNFDLLNGVFVDGIPPHDHFVGGEDAESLRKLSRITYGNMHLFRFSRVQRNRLVDLMLDYYRLHNSAIGELRSPAILASLFD